MNIFVLLFTYYNKNTTGALPGTLQGKALVVFLSNFDFPEKQKTLIVSTLRNWQAQRGAAEQPDTASATP